MAINAAATSYSAIDIIDGTVTEFYNLMDDAMRQSEVMPGRYNIITSPSYANPCPVAESSFTTIDLSTSSPSVLSLENTYITANLKVTLKCNKAHTYTGGAKANPQKYFIGWKSSLDAISKYQIFHNGKLFYDQPYCGEEAFVMQTIIPDHVKYTRSEQFTSHENAKKNDINVCGTYFTLQNLGADTAFTVEIPIKLDITQFLTFQEFKYLPGFFGTWGIRLWFSSKNMVICTVDPQYSLGTTGWTYHADATTKVQDVKNYTPRFVQLGDDFYGITNSTSDNVITTSLIHFTCSAFQAENVELNAAQFTLMFQIYDALKARYFQKPLAIPCMSMLYARFSGAMNKSNGFSSTHSGTVNCCEAMFILPYIDDDHHTICRNPKFKQMFLNIGGYGNYPQQSISTYPCDNTYTRFLTMTLDALNINNSSLMSMTNELSHSLRDNYVPSYLVTSTGTISGDTIEEQTTYDDTNFLIGIPFSNTEDFQGGLITNGQAQMKFQVSSASFHPPEGSDLDSLTITIGPTVIFLCDRAILLQTLPYSDQPNVKLVEEKLNV